uniref:Uncharacterized protein n=1 Tax=Knipowitschia caucasica TaxID=637954 RepID=A0AAV2M0G6_KNICA
MALISSLLGLPVLRGGAAGVDRGGQGWTELEKVEKVENVGQLEKVEKVEKVGQVEKVSQVEKVEKVGQLEKVEKVGQLEKVEKVGQLEKVEKVGQLEKVEKVGQLEKVEKVGQREKVEKVDQLDQVEKVEKVEKVGPVEKEEKVEKVEKTSLKSQGPVWVSAPSWSSVSSGPALGLVAPVSALPRVIKSFIVAAAPRLRPRRQQGYECNECDLTSASAVTADVTHTTLTQN